LKEKGGPPTQHASYRWPLAHYRKEGPLTQYICAERGGKRSEKEREANIEHEKNRGVFYLRWGKSLRGKEKGKRPGARAREENRELMRTRGKTNDRTNFQQEKKEEVVGGGFYQREGSRGLDGEGPRLLF